MFNFKELPKNDGYIEKFYITLDGKLRGDFKHSGDVDCSEDYIIHQYTGLKDAQGTEIYEGDILKHDIGLGNIYWEVIWDSVNGQWITTKENGGNTGNWFDYYVVAGNIFENPELLK